MVASGLDDQPRVAPIKLASHLLLAFSVFCLMLWTRWQVLGHARPLTSIGHARAARGLLLLIVIQIFFGALVAGLRAGLSYNTYPLMDGQWVPAGLHLMQPWWLNHLESVLTVQFQHRIGAIVVVAASVAFIAHAWHHLVLRPALRWLAAIIALQFLLGVATLLTGVNIWLASAHQLVALALVAWLVRILFLTPLDINQHALKIDNLK
jgi:cytochrome c oxidase assembly protein subunit 15